MLTKITLSIDRDLLHEVMRLGNFKTESEAVNYALAEYLRHYKTKTTQLP